MRHTSPVEASDEVIDTSRSPEEKLMIAVLARAIRDYLGDISPKNTSKSKARCAIMRTAQGWMHSLRTDDEYSFHHVCETLNIEKRAVFKFIADCQEVLSSSPNLMDMPLRQYRREVGMDAEAKTRTHYVLTQIEKLRHLSS